MEKLLDSFSALFAPMMNEWQTSLTIFIICVISFVILLYYGLKREDGGMNDD